MTTYETKDRILDAAERLFAERGFEGTSLRTLTGKAGVNLAAVHYHFGSKEELLRATAARRLQPINQERLRQLDQIEAAAGPGPLPLEPVLEAFLRPALEVGKNERGDRIELRQIAARIYSEPMEIVRPLVAELFGELAQRFVRALCRALPDLRSEEVALRLQFTVGVMLHVVAGHLAKVGDPRVGTLVSDDEVLLHSMITFVAAGLRAPSARLPRSAKRGRGGKS